MGTETPGMNTSNAMRLFYSRFHDLAEGRCHPRPIGDFLPLSGTHQGESSTDLLLVK